MIDVFAALFSLFLLAAIVVLVVGVFITVRRRLRWVPPMGTGAHDD